ncbi:unnamed protein product, partial [marine sediment metagenome]
MRIIDNLQVNNDLTVQGPGIYSSAYGIKTGVNTVTVNGNMSVEGTGLSDGTYSVLGNMSWSGGQIYGVTINLSGNLNWTGGTIYTPTFVLNGSAAQGITSTGNSFYNLTVTNASANGVTFSDSSGVTNNFVCITPSAKMTFTGTTTHTWNDINLNGGAVGTRITMQSSDASDWLFNVTSQTDVSYVDVSHSNALGGIEIDASNGTNNDGGNNLNWDFGVTISGTCRQYDQASNCPDAETV